ncbi:effector-associated domain 2-containing protein [Actinoplanes sp. CA-142083]|uniref:effector-associated domain 2-containing protein n=1 Tax=Actinoplanes sp. CA-142083 TaxID=3239903 RepID=UPI003D9123A5
MDTGGPDPALVSIGVVTAITVETLAVREVLDDVVTVHFEGDHHPYHLGKLPSSSELEPHVVVVAQQTRDGTRDAAWLCGHMPHTFESLRAFVMCGIAAGVPSDDPARHVALGDIVVATDVIDYRHERRIDGAGVLRGASPQPGAVWMDADHQVQSDEMMGVPPWLPLLETAGDPFRRPHPNGRPRAHRGRVGSADLLLRDRAFRDGLARELGLLAFEMEGAGVAIGAQLGGRSWYMVRGIADHGDNLRKNDTWHPYAALAAACYLRSVLARCAPLLPGRHRQRSADSLDPLNAIADALVDLRVMRDEQQRRAVLDLLPAAIRAQIPENSMGRLHLIQTVTTLERYPQGLEVLLAALRLTLGEGSPEFAAAERVLRVNWRSE